MQVSALNSLVRPTVRLFTLRLASQLGSSFLKAAFPYT
jgi:hypothetical protein